MPMLTTADLDYDLDLLASLLRSSSSLLVTVTTVSSTVYVLTIRDGVTSFVRIASGDHHYEYDVTIRVDGRDRLIITDDHDQMRCRSTTITDVKVLEN